MKNKDDEKIMMREIEELSKSKVNQRQKKY